MFRPSGGLLYHWRALRHGRRWRPFRHAVAEWLDGWRPAARELIVIGPSAGHTLTTPFLKRFARVHAYDLDPLAAPLFRLRHPGVRVRFRRLNVFWRDGKLSIDAMDAILARHPDAAILFSNVIGQVLLEGRADERAWYGYLDALRARLNGRAWASYHDLYTHEGAEIIDHLTAGKWTSDLQRRRFEWDLTPTSRHVIEGVRPAP